MRSLYFLYLLLVFAFSSCKEAVPPVPVYINSISPLSGQHSTVVTIIGDGFSSNPSENVVMFNGREATVQSATDSKLVVLVPKAAGTGPVTIRNTKTNLDVKGPEFSFTFSAVVSTLAGTGRPGLANGLTIQAEFNYPTGVAADGNGTIYVADSDNRCIWKITSDGVVSTLAGSRSAGFVDGTGPAAKFDRPTGIAIDQAGTIYVADTDNHAIRKVTPAGRATTLAGAGRAGNAEGQGVSAQFNLPKGIALDAAGNLFIADAGNNKIRRVAASGEVTTWAGNGLFGYVNKLADSAEFGRPSAIALSNKDMLVVDSENHCLRKITPGDTVKVSTFAGTNAPGFMNGGASSAMFYYPSGVVVDKAGNVFITDSQNHAIRIIEPSGRVSTLAGNGKPGFKDGAGTEASFNSPTGIALDKDGVIYVADYTNHVIRKIVVE